MRSIEPGSQGLAGAAQSPLGSGFVAARRPGMTQVSNREADAGHAFAEGPEALSQGGVDGPGAHAAPERRVGGDGFGDVAILAIDAAHALELRIRGAPDAGGGALARRLEALVELAALVDPAHGALL